MKRLGLCIAVMLVVGIGEARAQFGVPPFDSDNKYPKTGNKNGGILVKGTVALAGGWNPTGVGFISAWRNVGGVLTIMPLAVSKNGNWGDDGAGKWIEVEIVVPTSGQDYWVTVQITVTDGKGNNKNLLTTPLLAKSK